MDWGYYPKYVSVEERKAKALRAVKKLEKKGQKFNPVKIESKAIATSAWGKAWCKNLEFYSDYANRLPRGRSYVRNGLVVDLNIIPGEIQAIVYGTHLYDVFIKIVPTDKKKWQKITKECSGKIDSLLELLQGKLSKGVMEIITRQESGLFPSPKEIKLSCSCPDSAIMCKHVAAVLYAIGARLDTEPEALFTLRQVDHMNLITAASATGSLVGDSKDAFETTDLSQLFGIDIEESKQATSSKVLPIKAKPKKPKAKSKPILKPIKKAVSKNKQKSGSKEKLRESHMPLIPNITIGKGKATIGKFRLYMSYLHSAKQLRAAALDARPMSGPDFCQNYLIVSFYLYRHALELGLKTLCHHKLVGKHSTGHNLQKIFDVIHPNISTILKENGQYIVDRAMDPIQVELRLLNKSGKFEQNRDQALEIYAKRFNKSISNTIKIFADRNVAEDEQLFRYLDHKNGKKLEDIKTIPQEDINIIESAGNNIHTMELLLCEIERNKNNKK